MPKGPVLYREHFYTRLRDGSFLSLDWNVVNTTLGGMVEPRQLMYGNRKITQVDVTEISFNKVSEIDGNQFWRLYNTGGNQLPVDFNRQ